MSPTTASRMRLICSGANGLPACSGTPAAWARSAGSGIAPPEIGTGVVRWCHRECLQTLCIGQRLPERASALHLRSALQSGLEQVELRPATALPWSSTRWFALGCARGSGSLALRPSVDGTAGIALRLEPTSFGPLPVAAPEIAERA